MPLGSLKEGNPKILADHDAFFSRSDLILVSRSADAVELATAVRARYGLRTPDALHAASCLQLGDDATPRTGDHVFQRVDGCTHHHTRALNRQSCPCVLSSPLFRVKVRP